MKKIISFFCFMLLVSGLLTGYAQSPQAMTLKDGSTLNGKILKLENQQYTVETSFGDVQIPADDIVRINQIEPSQGLSRPQPSEEQMAEYQQKLLSDPKIMNSIQAISQDQDLVDKFLDPEFMNIIMSKDLEKMQDHPQFQELLSDPRIQELIGQAQKNIAP